jgi:hypothetical protein
MNSRLKRPLERRTPRWWAFSIAAHTLLIAVLAQIVFRYPIGQLVGIPKPEPVRERLQFIQLPAQPTESSGGASNASAGRSAPAALRAPVETPAELPPPAPVDSSRAQAAGGTGTGLGGDGSGPATGVMPRQPDARIALSPHPIGRVHRPTIEQVDSIVELAIGVVRDSLAIAAAQRRPGDWTMRGKDGKVWGWDPQGNIRLGKFTIPGALLALLPLNMQSPMSPIEQRSVAYIRRDIMENAQRSINEDEFRAAVKRIRERKERERRDGQVATSTPDSR